nr:FlgD immunoglobulin-like domain containing protein [Candidatus Cloacimonadota bacterium]
DKLKFYIDGVEKNAWSGDVPWTEAEYNVTAGVHTYKWEYSKDISVNSGSDCAWIDKIIFPNAGGGSDSAPMAYMNTDPIDFGTVEPNETTVKSIVVVNFGLLPLSGELTVPTPYSVESANFVVEAESNLTIPVTYAPTSEGTHSGQITVATNDTTHPSFVIEITGTCGTNSSDSVLPKVTKLQGNYPNPFNPVTNISFSLKENSPVTIDIYNVKGQLVKQLVNEAMQAGNHTVVWNGKDQNNKSVSSGVYFYRMQSKNYAGTKKMLLMK